MDIKYFTLGSRAKYYPETLEPSTDFPFTDKESYFKWVSEWKEAYGTLAQNIREVKSARRGADMSDNQKIAHRLSLEAYGMLVYRKHSKAHSWALKQRAGLEVAV
jgi:hypothetical protein